MGQLTVWQLASIILSKRKLLSLCNLISEVISHNFDHILFIRSKLVGPSHIQEEGITQRCEYGDYWGPSERLHTIVYT